MKVFLVLFCLLSSTFAQADRTYEFRATGVDEREVPSCGHTWRLLNTKRKLVVHDDGAYSIGGVRWVDAGFEWVSEAPGWARLAYEFPDGIYYLKLVTNDRKLVGSLVRISVTPKRGLCRDAVLIEGKRL